MGDVVNIGLSQSNVKTTPETLTYPIIGTGKVPINGGMLKILNIHNDETVIIGSR